MIIRAAWLVATMIALAGAMYAILWIVTHLGGNSSIWSG